jgi:hypothetical protein
VHQPASYLKSGRNKIPKNKIQKTKCGSTTQNSNASKGPESQYIQVLEFVLLFFEI